jgi:hypothetical protein
MTAAGAFRVLVMLVVGASCGVSNAERPYADAGAAPIAPAVPGAAGAPGTGGAAGAGMARPTPDGGATDASTAAETSPAMDVAVDAGPTCPAPAPVCAPTTAPASPTRAWKNFGSGILATGAARHRGRDLFYVADAATPQWLIGKFSYGPFDIALTDEEVDVYLLRGCVGSWELMGTAVTTKSGAHAETEGADDSGGRVYFQLTPAQRLAPGRHRVRFVVAGDGSSTELFVEVVPAGTRLAVLDVDGTLTTSEAAEFGALLTGQTPAAEPDAANVVAALAAKGYRPYYLTARPEWLTNRTREFLDGAGFPPGIVETTTGGSGALGNDAATFKKAALARIAGKGLTPAFALGNGDSDASAYAAANVTAASRVFLRYTDGSGGRRVDSYGELLPVIAQLPPACRQ